MMMIMAMAVGLCICCVGGASTLVTLVNEKIIDVDFLDFLLIAGWGKEKTDEDGDTGGGGSGKYSSSTNCIDAVIDTCKSASDFTTLYTVDDHDTCVSNEKTTCLNDGGTWASSLGTYPNNCSAGARVECVTYRGKERETCLNEYKKKCKAAGGSSGITSPTANTPGTGGSDQNLTVKDICKKYGSIKPSNKCKYGTLYHGICMRPENKEKCKADVERILG